MKKLMKIFSLNGCASRKEWWLVYLSFWIVLFVETQIEILLFGDREEASLLFMILFLAYIWPLFATQVRRWHDRGKSGFWCLINIIPIIGNLWTFVELGFLPSVGTNPWGNRNEYRQT
jgi:uncharacterized membrane protein YhaH (DUF805 family)